MLDREVEAPAAVVVVVAVDVAETEIATETVDEVNEIVTQSQNMNRGLHRLRIVVVVVVAAVVVVAVVVVAAEVAVVRQAVPRRAENHQAPAVNESERAEVSAEAVRGAAAVVWVMVAGAAAAADAIAREAARKKARSTRDEAGVAAPPEVKQPKVQKGSLETKHQGKVRLIISYDI